MDSGGFNRIQKEFVEWVIGTEEEDPFPYEIKYIYFFLEHKKHINSLWFGGAEINDCSNLPYFPLEAQAFFNKSFNFCKEKVIDANFVKLMVDLAFQNTSFADIFKNRIIYVCSANNATFSKIKVK